MNPSIDNFLKRLIIAPKSRQAAAVELSGYSIGWISEAERNLRKVHPDLKKRLLEIYTIHGGKK